jgi:septal ring factor EnvC (AmiA/AmiB activator)
MKMEHEEYLQLKSQLISDLNGEYKRLDDCEKQVEKEENKIDKIFKDITQMRQDFSSMRIERAKDSTKLSIVIGILCAIAVPLVSVCVKLLFGS